jgi:uncharacterized protein (TIGR02452 family)
VAPPKNLVDIALETLAVVDRGDYPAPDNRPVPIGALAKAAVAGTVLHRPDELERLLARTAKENGAARVTVTQETTAEAARRLAEAGGGDVLALNFASARNPGGGFLGGARAQEEDLCRASALYPCVITQRDYYAANAAVPGLYTDHMIYSPRVPFFRDRELRFLEAPYTVSVLTAPAPNVGAYDLNAEGAKDALAQTLDRRAAFVLCAAEEHGHETLVLGAWGCGAFRNDPAQVADVFARHLASPRFARSFREVCFAIFDAAGKKKNFDAFTRRFS